MSESFNFFKSYIESTSNDTVRIDQAKILDELLINNFNFDYVECIETGCASGGYDNFGVYLSKYCKDNNGKFTTVDISEDYINKSKILYNNIIGENSNEYVIDDSISFLKKYNGGPNLVHLDSWDLDLKNPIPSMLHGWLEFQSIKDKMPSGGICIIDDNFLKGTWVQWNSIENNRIIGNEIIDINYDIVGKGALIYHYCKNYITDWEIIGNHYQSGPNVKLIIKKK